MLLLIDLLKLKKETQTCEKGKVPLVELIEHLSEFFCVCEQTKEKNTKLKAMFSSFKRHLKSTCYPDSLINDLVFEKARKSVTSFWSWRNKRAS